MAEIWFDLRKKRILIDERDLLIGTTAIVRNLLLITRNLVHFRRLENLWVKVSKC